MFSVGQRALPPIKKRMISPEEFAEAIGRPYQTVIRWLRNGMVPGVEVIEESRGPIYLIPQKAVVKFRGFHASARPTP